MLKKDGVTGQFEVLFLFSVAPQTQNFPTNQGLQSEIYVYGINTEPNEKYPNGMVVQMTPIDGSDFNSTGNFEINDITSSASGIFILTQAYAYAFQYESNQVANMRFYQLQIPAYKIAVLQEGYRFSICLVSTYAIYEFDWSNPALIL